MKLKIVNKDGVGNNTRILVMDGEKEIGQLSCVERIEFDPITVKCLIRAKLFIDGMMLDIKPFSEISDGYDLQIKKKKTRYELQKIHNDAEWKSLGFRAMLINERIGSD